MNRKERKFVLTLLAALLLALVVTPREREDEWVTTYERDDARPYGSRMLFETLPALFDDRTVQPVVLSPYEFLVDSSYSGTSYVFITHLFAPDASEAGVLLAYAADGNEVFISANEIEGALADTLGLSIQTGFGSEVSVGDTLRVNLVNPMLGKNGGYWYDATPARRYFAFEQDERQQGTVLGIYERYEDPNFLRIPWGRGAFYVSCVPLSFTNYTMLVDDGYDYAYKALSYLSPAHYVFWDAYYKPFRREVRTPLRYLLSDPILRSTLILAIVGMALFILFHARRRQRPIPVIEPPQNTTVDFVETVGRLYFSQGDHRNLLHKLVGQWKHYVRTKLLVDFKQLDGVSVERVARRSGVEPETVRRLLGRLIDAENAATVDEAMLHDAAKALDEFYASSER